MGKGVNLKRFWGCENKEMEKKRKVKRVDNVCL